MTSRNGVAAIVRAVRRRRRAVPPLAVLLGVGVVVAVLVGLVSMHTIGLHGMGTPTSAVVLTDSGEHTSAGVVASHDPSHVPGESGCAGCGDGHVGMALMCVFVLFIVVLFLLLPRVAAALWFGAPTRAGPGFRSVRRIFSRAPSLHVLCISRT